MKTHNVFNFSNFFNSCNSSNFCNFFNSSNFCNFFNSSNFFNSFTFSNFFNFLYFCLLCSCEVTGWQDTRRPIEDEGAFRVSVRVRLDWNRSALAPVTPDERIPASVWFFPQEEGQSPYVLTTDEVLDSISLPPGDYHILAFNGLLSYNATRDEQNGGSFRNIGFRGTDRYDTFEAYCTTPLILPASLRSRAEDDLSAPMAAPEALAVDHYRNEATGDVLRLTMDMVDKGIKQTLDFAPERLIEMLQVVVHVKNLVSATDVEGVNVASIGGLAGSVRLASGERGVSPPVAHYFTVNHRQYDEGSQTDGTLRGECLTFSRAEDLVRDPGTGVRNRLRLYLTLRDGSPFDVIEHDVTGRFTPDGEYTGELRLTLDAGMGLLGANDYIELPDTQEPGGSGSGLDANVNGWGEHVDVPIEL
jgi:hypothetical protein